jgi:hypothetical protein
MEREDNYIVLIIKRADSFRKFVLHSKTHTQLLKVCEVCCKKKYRVMHQEAVAVGDESLNQF